MTDGSHETPNSGCLEDMHCPNCGATEPFLIAATSWFRVFDDGVDDHNDVEWEATSKCACEAYDYFGTVADFTVSPD